jgi:hypothetical protein
MGFSPSRFAVDGLKAIPQSVHVIYERDPGASDGISLLVLELAVGGGLTVDRPELLCPRRVVCG